MWSGVVKRKIYGVRGLASRLKRRPERVARPTELQSGDATERLSVLEAVSILFMQPKPVMRSLARAAQQLSVTKGESLVREGEANESLFIVVRGQFAASVGSKGGDSVHVSMFGPADIFGVVSMMSNAPAPTTITATMDSEVLILDRQTVAPHLDADSQLAAQLQRVSAQRGALLESMSRRTRIPTGMGSVIAIYSPKGGAGKTTIAVNLCAALAASHPGEVALVDLGLPYNDAALLAGQVPTTCLARLVVDMGGAFDELLLSAAMHHPSQFWVLPVVLTPEEADLITPAVALKALDTLRREFKFVVVDCCVQLSETVLSVLEQAQQVVVITTPRLASLKDVPHLLDILQDVLHVPAGRIQLAINHTAPRAAIGREEIEKMSRRRVAVEFGFDSAAERASIQGDLVSRLRPKGPVSGGASQLAAKVGGRVRAAPRGRELPSSLHLLWRCGGGVWPSLVQHGNGG